jgi:hypothetical protein
VGPLSHRLVRCFVLSAIVVSGCASSDLGTPCHLLKSDNTEMAPRPGHDIVQSGSGECEQFSCVSFNGAAAQCSMPCDAEGEACLGGMVCRRTVLDPDLMREARQRLEGHDDDHNGVDDYQDLLAGTSDSLYCGPTVQ